MEEEEEGKSNFLRNQGFATQPRKTPLPISWKIFYL